MKHHYIAPVSRALYCTGLMDEKIITSSTNRLDPSQGLGRRFNDTWDFNEEVSNISNDDFNTTF